MRIFNSLILDYSHENYKLKKTKLQRTRTFYQSNYVPLMKYAEIDNRFINSIWYKYVWIEAFFIFSVIWSFTPCLNDAKKKEFDFMMKQRLLEMKQDI